LYTRLQDYPKAALALKRHNFIDDSIRRQDEAIMVAAINSWDSIQSKKKLYTTRPYKPNATKSIVSL